MVGWSMELLSGAVGAIGRMWVSVADGWLGCAVVVVSSAERAVGGTLCWGHLKLLVEMETIGVPWVGQLVGDMGLVAMVVDVGSCRWVGCKLLGLGGD